MFPSSHPSEFFRPHTNEESLPVSLSEAVFDASAFDRTRESLPKKYRTHLDELRKNIFAFCDEFEIPREALGKKELLGTYLASPKIPPERLAEAALFFERFNHLVTHKELLKETLPKHLQEIERLYHLSEQYNAQVSLLEQAGILKKGTITGIDGNRYPIPTLEHIARRLLEREYELSVKRDQGFTKLLLVPFGMSLDTLARIFRTFLKCYKKDHPEFGRRLPTVRDGTDSQRWNPFDIGLDFETCDNFISPKILYYPQSFDSIGDSKMEILQRQATHLDASFPGWTVHLFQPGDPGNPKSPGFAPIYQKGKGGDQERKLFRPPVEGGQSSRQYLRLLQEALHDPSFPYREETGMTPEDWIIAFMTQLWETGEPLDLWPTTESTSSCLIGSFFPHSAHRAGNFTGVPYALWDTGTQESHMGLTNASHEIEDFGARFSVLI